MDFSKYSNSELKDLLEKVKKEVDNREDKEILDDLILLKKAVFSFLEKHKIYKAVYCSEVEMYSDSHNEVFYSDLITALNDLDNYLYDEIRVRTNLIEEKE